MIAGFFQFSPERGRPERNAARLEEALRSTRADLLVCPELATTGYLYRDKEALRAVAEPVPSGPTVTRLAAASRETGRAIVFGIAERAGAKIYNSAVAIQPEGPVVCYRKAHLFDTETEVFDRAGASPRHAKVAGADVGIMVCFDWRFPEMARVLAVEGADVIAHPANLVHPYCQDAMITRSLENRVFTITASRTGSETVGDLTLAFTGRSQIVSPRGERLVSADSEEECVRTAEIDPLLARDKKVTARNDLFADRRPELYRALDRPPEKAS
ncbi:MAG TPA: nitrilase-related carbon-nitrogen hydrolase [Candidatus Eisenbacteria bacterium]|nr:nitrilase-related carbon-nitrogen hydrolase [Candidatus Eisenbacteria bacterium]